MKGIWKAIFFAAIVALAANALGLFYDVSAGVALDIYDVIAKFLIAFTAVFVFAVSVGYGLGPGITASLVGPIGFAIYYPLAAESLQRSSLTFANAGVSVVLNIIIFAFVYWATLALAKKKAGRLLFSAIVALAASSLYWTWLTVLNITGIIGDLPLSIGSALSVLIMLFVFTFIATLLGRTWRPGILAGIAFGLAGLIANAAALDSIVRIFVLAIPYIIVKTMRGGK